MTETQIRTQLQELQATGREINEALGWYDSERAFGDDIALLHTEVSEMFEAYRRWGLDDATQAVVNEAVESLTGEKPVLPKPEGVGSEAADVLIRLLDTCERNGIDLGSEVERKFAFNRTRAYRHGNKRV